MLIYSSIILICYGIHTGFYVSLAACSVQLSMAISMEQQLEYKCHTNPQVSCNDCRLNSICLPISLQLDDINKLDEIVKRGRPLQKGHYIYRANDEFKSVYAVRSGAMKTFTLNDQGVEQVTGFYLPGEILGLDGLGDDTYTNSAIALETSAVCEIPFAQLEHLSLTIPSLQRRFFKIMGREIIDDQKLISLLSKCSAEERVASFLLSISTRNQRRQLSASSFRLSMSRTDMANYLGLTIETTSREISRLNKKKVIKINRNDVEIYDFDALKGLANSVVCT